MGYATAVNIANDEIPTFATFVKNMDNGNQEEVAVENLASYISTKD